jgi:hypothetical protein
MHVHRLRYTIHTRCIQLNPENYHVSHLCHSKTCVNILHLSLEPPHVNPGFSVHFSFLATKATVITF